MFIILYTYLLLLILQLLYLFKVNLTKLPAWLFGFIYCVFTTIMYHESEPNNKTTVYPD